LRDVLSVGVDRDAIHILQGVGRDEEPRRRARADVAVVPDVAERRLGEQIEQPIAIDVDEPVPLADVDSIEAVTDELPAA